MKNPCDDCLVKVNCTQICFNKKNYGTLLSRALDDYQRAIGKTNYSFEHFANYSKLFIEHRKDEVKIKTRINNLLSEKI